MSAAGRRKRGEQTQPRPKRGPAASSAQTREFGSPCSVAKSLFFGRAWWVSPALIAAIWIVYGPVLHYGFITWDDPLYVTENSFVTRGLTWDGVAWAFTTGHDANWFPLTWLSFMLDAQFYGLKSGGYHLTNLLLHTANTLLLFGLLSWVTGVVGRSAFVAALFAIHPIHVESVAWVAERKDVLSTLFWMLILGAYFIYVWRPRPGRYLVVVLLFALGLMAKAMLVTLPFVLLLLDYWPLGRFARGPDGLELAPGRRRLPIATLVREKLWLFLLMAASAVITYVVQRQGGAVNDLEMLPLGLRLENALVAYVAYIGKMLWPARLAAFYPYPQSISRWWVMASILILAAISIAVIGVSKRLPYLAVGWLWYLGTLVPVIGLVQVGSQAMADRYTYVPLIGLFLMVAWGAHDLLARWAARNVALPAVAVLVILGCTITARGQVRWWENSMALWQHALDVTTGNFRAENGVGEALRDQGKADESVGHFSEAIRIRPNYAIAHANLAQILASQGRTDAAIAHYTEAIRLQPGLAEAHNNLGALLGNQGRYSEAIPQYEEAIRIEPDYADAHYNLGIALQSQGSPDGARQQFQEALRINPNHSLARQALDSLMSQVKIAR